MRFSQSSASIHKNAFPTSRRSTVPLSSSSSSRRRGGGLSPAGRPSIAGHPRVNVLVGARCPSPPILPPRRWGLCPENHPPAAGLPKILPQQQTLIYRVRYYHIAGPNTEVQTRISAGVLRPPSEPPSVDCVPDMPSVGDGHLGYPAALLNIGTGYRGQMVLQFSGPKCHLHKR